MVDETEAWCMVEISSVCDVCHTAEEMPGAAIMVWTDSSCGYELSEHGQSRWTLQEKDGEVLIVRK